mgnify:FL=1
MQQFKSASQGEPKQVAVPRLYPDITFDYAVPSSWQQAMSDRGFDDAADHFVTLYPVVGTAYIAPVTLEGVMMASIVCTHSA